MANMSDPKGVWYADEVAWVMSLVHNYDRFVTGQETLEPNGDDGQAKDIVCRYCATHHYNIYRHYM